MKMSRSSFIFKAGASLCAFLLVSSSLSAMELQTDQSCQQTAMPICKPPNTFSSHIRELVIEWRKSEKTNLVLEFAGTIVAKAFKNQSQSRKEKWETEFKIPPMPKCYTEWQEVFDKIKKMPNQEDCGNVQKWTHQSDKKATSEITSTVNTGSMDVDKEAVFEFSFHGSADQQSETYTDMERLSLDPSDLNDPHYWQANAIFPVVLDFVMHKLQEFEDEDIDWYTIEQQGLELAQKSIGEQCDMTDL